MDYLGKAVKFQHRVATGHARLRPGSAGQPTRHHIPVPTKLEIVDAIVLLEVQVEGEDFPRVSALLLPGPEKSRDERGQTIRTQSRSRTMFHTRATMKQR